MSGVDWGWLKNNSGVGEQDELKRWRGEREGRFEVGLGKHLTPTNCLI